MAQVSAYTLAIRNGSVFYHYLTFLIPSFEIKHNVLEDLGLDIALCCTCVVDSGGDIPFVEGCKVIIKGKIGRTA